MKLSRKNIVRIIIAIIAAALVIFIALTTRSTELVSSVRGGYTSYTQSRTLAEGDLIYGRENFRRTGMAPIRIKEIRIFNEKGEDIHPEAYVFYPPSQGMMMSGGQFNRKEFEERYGDNLAELDDITWLQGEDFEVAVVSEESKIRDVWIEVTYRVWGIFEKTVVSAEIEV